jgi:hypothetical protein
MRSARALVPLGLLAAALSACGNLISVTDAGQIGITVDRAGQPVIAVMTCAKATPWIELGEGRKASDPENKVSAERGSWKARNSFAGVEKLALAAPGGNWTTTRSPATGTEV